jgi:hypothetical protein
MPEQTIAIAPVRLARSRLRQALPSVLLLAAAAAAAVAGWVSGGPLGLALASASAVLGIIAVALVVVLMTVRMEVEVATLRLRWLGGERRYTLARGPVTRIAARGPGAVRIRSRIGAFGWALGPATLRDTEQIEIVRLAPVRSLILVPTDRGRLAIAAASEAELIDALSVAARVQQRLDDATGYLRTHPDPGPRAPAAPTPPAPAAASAGGGFLTGIERTKLEERLAAERAAALAAAEAERAAAMAMVPPAEAAPGAPDAAPARDDVTIGRRTDRAAWRGVGRSARRALPFVPAALPAIAGVLLWSAATVLGRMPTTDLALRPLLLALGLGAGGAVGVLAARTWYPRLAGLVSATAVVALLLVGRALLP